jgi:hypothetical protein
MAPITQKNILGRSAGASKKETRPKRFWLLDRKKEKSEGAVPVFCRKEGRVKCCLSERKLRRGVTGAYEKGNLKESYWWLGEKKL